MHCIRVFVPYLITFFASSLAAHTFSNSVVSSENIESYFGVAELWIHQNSAGAGFMVNNSSSKNILLTAIHIFKNLKNAENLCKSGLIKAYIPYRNKSGSARLGSGVCKSIIAASEINDMILIDLDFSEEPKLDLSKDGFDLAGTVPSTCTPLNMIGFPANFVGPAITKNCWVPPPNPEKSIFEVLFRRQNGFASRLYLESLTTFEARNELYKRLGTPMFSMSGRHNCTVYGGNSGGPIVIETTRIAVGMPATYDENTFDIETYASFHSTAGFVHEHKILLEELGVKIVNELDIASSHSACSR